MDDGLPDKSRSPSSTSHNLSSKSTVPAPDPPSPTREDKPPAKQPPVPLRQHRNLSAKLPPPRHSATSHPSASHRQPPPSPTSSTSSDDPVILRTNVPILKKARPGQPPTKLQQREPQGQPISAPSTRHPIDGSMSQSRDLGSLTTSPTKFNVDATSIPATTATTSSATATYPAPPPAFDPTHILPPTHPAPPPLFPPLPPLPLATPWNLRLLKTTTSWGSTLISPNAQSLASNPPNLGKSGTPPVPVANDLHSPALLHDYTPSTRTPSQQQRQMQQLNSLSTSMSKKDTQHPPANDFEATQKDCCRPSERR